MVVIIRDGPRSKSVKFIVDLVRIMESQLDNRRAGNDTAR